MIAFDRSELWFAVLVGCSVKITGLLSVAWIVAKAARTQSASFRHLVWSLGILASLMLPLLTFLLPDWDLGWRRNTEQFLWAPHPGADVSGSAGPSPVIVEVAAGAPTSSNFHALALLVWGIGFLVSSTRLFGGLARLAWVSATSSKLIDENWTRTVLEVSRKLRIKRPIRLRYGYHTALPITWGSFRPVILLPRVARKWQEDRRRVVVCHELAHIARGDWLVQILAEIARMVYWFHPLAWMAARHLRQDSEHACDDSVMNFGIEPSDYAEQLLDLAKTSNSLSSTRSAALALARQSNLERRFASMLNPYVNRKSVTGRAKSIAFLAAVFLLMPLAALRLGSQTLERIRGTIYDPSSAPVPNAIVIITGSDKNKTEMTTSGMDGRFSLIDLAPGEYNLKIVKAGFEDYKAPHILLQRDRETSRKIVLNVAPVNEEVDVVGERRPTAAPKTATKRARLGGDIQQPKLLNKLQPMYPASARAAGIEGTVLLHAVIGMDGSPLSLRVMNTEIDPELVRSALEAVSKWRYSPTLLNGEPIEVDTTITVNFRLTS